MIERATGVILRTRRLTETSLIVQWLSAEAGRISTVAKGALRPKSVFGGKLDLFYVADFTFSRSRRSELHTLREISLRSTNSALRHELGYLQQASYCAALVEQTTETDTPLPDVFHLFQEFLLALPNRPPSPLTVFAFEIKLLAILGLTPDMSRSHLEPKASELLTDLQRVGWPQLGTIHAGAPELAQLRQFLHGFLIYHLGRLARGRDSALNPVHL